MGDSSVGWAAAFTATTSDTLELPDEQGVEGAGPAWDEIEHCIHTNLNRSR